jgi:hypothetical protein
MYFHYNDMRKAGLRNRRREVKDRDGYRRILEETMARL